MLSGDHRLPGEADLGRIGDGDDLHDAAVDELLHPLPHRRLGQPDRLADRGVRAPAVLLQLLDDRLGHVVRMRCCGSKPPADLPLLNNRIRCEQRIRRLNQHGLALLQPKSLVNERGRRRDEGRRALVQRLALEERRRHDAPDDHEDDPDDEGDGTDQEHATDMPMRRERHVPHGVARARVARRSASRHAGSTRGRRTGSSRRASGSTPCMKHVAARCSAGCGGSTRRRRTR